MEHAKGVAIQQSPLELDLGQRLNLLLADIKYDEINLKIRGADYHLYPFPLDAYPLLKHDLGNQFLEKNGYLDERQSLAVRLLLMNETVSLEAANKLLDPQVISLGVQVGIFKLDGDNLKTDHLALASKKLVNGETVFFFADVPSHYHDKESHNRVYANHDSYLLHEFLRTQPNTYHATSLLELGSGSSFQLLAASKLNPTLKHCWGLEIDERARSISRFNVALNSLEGKVQITDDLATIRATSFDLIISNPPFLPCPEQVEVQGQSFDLKNQMPVAGYGGIDGLDTVNIFLKIVEERLNTDGAALIFGQFAHADQRQFYLAEAVKSRQLDVRLQPFYGHDAIGEPISDISVNDMAANIASVLLQDNQIGRDLHQGLYDAIAASFRQNSISGSVTAILHCRRGVGIFSTSELPCFQDSLAAFPDRSAPAHLFH